MPTFSFLRDLVLAHSSRSWVPKRNVATSYALGDGVSRNGPRARKWYQRAADAGDESALYDLGMMLLEGEGGPADVSRGQEMLLHAARLGDGSAQKVLAYAFREGHWGFPIDPTEAARWQKLAKAQGLQV